MEYEDQESENEYNLTISDIVTSKNVAELLDDEELKEIGQQCQFGVDNDLNSRSEWEERNADAFKLALQVVGEKTFPWPDASNVKFPLVTIAALQYHARAYPALLSSTTPVECRVIGSDDDGKLTEQSRRISTHMSWQVLEEDEGWEEGQDKLLLIQPIIGTVFKKSYFDTVKKHNVSELVMPDDLIVNYWTQNLDSSTRVTHRLKGITSNILHERRASGLYLDTELMKDMPRDTEAEDSTAERQGLMRPEMDDTTPYDLMEQHCLWDLDGDGYKEPYIVTFEYSTGTVLRIVARFDSGDVVYGPNDEVITIKGHCHFTKYGFIPSPDGGFYDLGFGALLGPLNESVNTAINQLIDSGTMYITGGGFLGRGAKIRGGDYAFKPWEWKRVDSTGDDLRKNVVPLETREPSRVLFDLLSLLINYGERIAGAVDVLSGIAPGQNTPAETTRTVRSEGLKIFNGIYKRTWRSMKEEYRKLYWLNSIFLEQEQWYEDLTNGQNAMIMLQDYHANQVTVRPSANPHISSDEERTAQADMLVQWAANTPGANAYEANRRWLEAHHIPAIDTLYDEQAAKTPMTDPKIQIEQMKLQVETAKLQLQQKSDMMNFLQQGQLNEAKIRELIAIAQELEAKAVLNLAQAKGVADGHDVARLEATIGMAKEIHKGYLDMLKLMNEVRNVSSNTGGMGTMETQQNNQSVPSVPK